MVYSNIEEAKKIERTFFCDVEIASCLKGKVWLGINK